MPVACGDMLVFASMSAQLTALPHCSPFICLPLPILDERAFSAHNLGKPHRAERFPIGQSQLIATSPPASPGRETTLHVALPDGGRVLAAWLQAQPMR